MAAQELVEDRRRDVKGVQRGLFGAALQRVEEAIVLDEDGQELEHVERVHFETGAELGHVEGVQAVFAQPHLERHRKGVELQQRDWPVWEGR